jgi:plastocyanin
VGDFNGDGLPDFALAYNTALPIEVFLNAGHGPARSQVTGFPSAVTAGVAGTVTVTIQDSSGHTVTGYTGTVHFTSSDLQAVLPADYTFTAADAGVHSFSLTLKTAGTQSITATDTGSSSITGSQTGIAVSPASVDHLSLTSAGTVAAGITFDLVVIAQDSFGNSVTSYTGTAAFSSTEHDPAVMLPAQYTFTAGDNGTHTFSGGATLFTPGQKTITAEYRHRPWRRSVPATSPKSIRSPWLWRGGRG